MYRAILFKLMLLLVFVACTKKTEQLSLEKEVLIQVLADVHLAEGALLSVRPAQKDSLKEVYYNHIYEIHEVSFNDFEHDMKILKFNPKMMENIYEKVMEELNQKEKELEKEEGEKKKKEAERKK